MGGQNIAIETGIEINGLDAARASFDLPMQYTGGGKLTAGNIQYLIFSNEQFYAISFSYLKDSDKEPSEFEPIAKSFRINRQ